jgi:hypothetical protein
LNRIEKINNRIIGYLNTIKIRDSIVNPDNIITIDELAPRNTSYGGKNRTRKNKKHKHRTRKMKLSRKHKLTIKKHMKKSKKNKKNKRKITKRPKQ